MCIHIYIPLMYMNILIYGYGHLTSSILSEYPSEQIRTSAPHPGAGSLLLRELNPAKLIQLNESATACLSWISVSELGTFESSNKLKIYNIYI